MSPNYTSADFHARVLSSMALTDPPATTRHIGLQQAAVLIGVIDEPEPKVILTQRNTGMRTHSGQIAFPGGKRDADDQTFEAAAIREAHEEIGLDPSFVQTIGRLSDYPAPSGFIVTPILAVIRRGFTLRLNPAEVDTAFEVPLSFLMNPENHQIESRFWNGSERRFYVMTHEERRIWGVTAGIIRALYERLYT